MTMHGIGPSAEPRLLFVQDDESLRAAGAKRPPGVAAACAGVAGSLALIAVLLLWSLVSGALLAPGLGALAVLLVASWSVLRDGLQVRPLVMRSRDVCHPFRRPERWVPYEDMESVQYSREPSRLRVNVRNSRRPAFELYSLSGGELRRVLKVLGRKGVRVVRFG